MQIRNDLLNDLLNDLQNADYHNYDTFPWLVVRAVTYLNVSNQYIADLFEVSEITVARWQNGTASPFPTVKKVIYNKFIELINVVEE